jgi:hypothetical protein
LSKPWVNPPFEAAIVIDGGTDKVAIPKGRQCKTGRRIVNALVPEVPAPNDQSSLDLRLVVQNGVQ